jgi:hypothetical protein
MLHIDPILIDEDAQRVDFELLDCDAFIIEVNPADETVLFRPRTEDIDRGAVDPEAPIVVAAVETLLTVSLLFASGAPT